MRHVCESIAVMVAALGMVFVPNDWAAPGDGIGGVNVGIRKKPGGGLIAQSPTGVAFDRVTLAGDRDFLDRLSPEKLPAGWTMSRPDRKTVVVSGPAVDQPVRIILALEGELPKQISYEVAHAGQVIGRGQNVVPSTIEIPEVRNSLQGLVYLPDDTRPGDTLTFKTATDELPRGTWSLAGQVVEEFEESEWASAMAGVNKTRSNIKGITAPLPGVTLVPTDGSSCNDLAPLAAMMAAQSRLVKDSGKSGTLGMQRYDVARVPGPTSEATVDAFAVEPLPEFARRPEFTRRHETQKAVLQNIRAFYAVAPAEQGSGISIKEEGIEVFAVSPSGEASAKRSFYESRSNTARRAGSAEPVGSEPDSGEATHKSYFESRSNTANRAVGSAEPVGSEPGSGEATHKSFYESRSNTARSDPMRFVAIRGEATPDGCLFTDREPSDLELARAIINTNDEPRPSSSTAGLSGTVYAVDIPEELSNAVGLALQFHDVYGDLVVDVPRAPVEILPPRPPAEPPPQPCIETATAFVQAKSAFCVCGTFPGPSAAWNLLLNERALPPGATLSTSATAVWLRFPEGSSLGRYVLSGPLDAGFTPSCRAITHLIEIRGEIDSTRLLRGETVPMRLTILGTSERVPIRLRNVTPAIIEIEGGVEQTVESSGGGANTITRSVRALQRGDFNVEWTLATPPCPCSSP